MIVYFFETTNATPHLETSMELAKKHIDDGDDVCYYFLGHSVPFAEFVRKRSVFSFGCFPERKAAQLVGDKLKFIQPNIEIINTDIVTETHLENKEIFQLLKYKNYNAGLSVLSSLISMLNMANPVLRNYKDAINSILISGISVYEFVSNEIQKNKPDLIYLFNGRFAVNRAILDAASECGVPARIHERGANKEKFIANSWPPHDLSRIRECILSSWAKSEILNRSDVASHFFKARRGGVDDAWTSFTSKQKINQLPDLPVGKKIIAYFSSCDDEFSAVGDLVKWDRWPDQLSAFKDLVELVSRHSDLYLVIRLHPHKAFKHNSDLLSWLKIPLPSNAKIIFPNDPIDSYALIERADVVVTSGSTIGIESVYWGTPSICLGPSLYSQLDAVHLPVDYLELERMLLDYSLSVDSKKSLPSGFYMSTFGINFSFYQPETLFSGRFMGVNLQSHGFNKIVRLFLSLPAKVFKKTGDLLSINSNKN